MSSNRHRAKTPTLDFVGARVVERRGEGLYGRCPGDSVAHLIPWTSVTVGGAGDGPGGGPRGRP